MERTKRTISVYIIMFLGLSCWAQEIRPETVTVKFRVLLETDANHSKKASNLSVRVDETFDHGYRDYEVNSGKFSMEVAPNKQCLVLLSVDGYETKSVLLSTVGFQSGNKHVFRLIITLDRVGSSNYVYPNQSVLVKYDYIETSEFVIRNGGESVSHLVKR